MRLPLKLLLILCALIVGVYATAPLWLPQVLARQLPPGWQLDAAEVSYPGLTGISINKMRVTGDMQAAGLAITATDLRFRYAGLKTKITSLSVDVHMQSAKDSTETPLSLDDLSLPITSLTGKLPALAIEEAQVAFHPGHNEPGNKPLVLNLQAFALIPVTDTDFHFSADAGIEGFPEIVGQLNLEVSSNTRKASLRFPETRATPAWLAISLEQSDTDEGTTTQIQTIFDTAPADQDWLDEILLRLTGGKFSQIIGSFDAHMDFAGNELQSIDHLSFVTDDLQVKMSDGSVLMSAALDVGRDGESINVSLPQKAQFLIEDTSGKTHELIGAAIPELQRGSHLAIGGFARISANSNFSIQTTPKLSLKYTGDINIGVTSKESIISLQSKETQISIRDFSNLENSTAKGLIAFSWEENQPMFYSTDRLEFSANKQKFATTGELQIDRQKIAFRQVTQFEIQFEDLHTKLQTGTPENPAWLELNTDQYHMQGELEFDLSMSQPATSANLYFNGPIEASQLVLKMPSENQSPGTTIEAYELALTTNLMFAEDQLISTGKGTFNDGRIASPVTSVSVIDLSWQNLDMINLTGNLQSKTLGFATQLDDEMWSGFDFDIDYEFLGNADVTGTGAVNFDAGPNLPFGFTGNNDKQIFEITLYPATIQLAQLGDLLRIAHVDLPESIILSDGFINLHGDVLVDGEISANMSIDGHELTASMLESSANKAGFSFKTSYGSSISANGPISIEKVSLAGGIDVTHIKADLKLNSTDTPELENLYAEAFDGNLIVEQLRFSGNKVEDTTAKLSHISLQSLLAYADIDGLDGSGFLEISLPLSSDEVGIYVENGIFKSDGPGHLAYTQIGVASSNIGLQALENFQYTDLSGSINYQSDGAYQITIRLEGKNPDLYGGHPIVFNLTIGGLLPELFESMFLTGNFEESILKQIETN
jgi:hypothetical protein